MERRHVGCSGGQLNADPGIGSPRGPGEISSSSTKGKWIPKAEYDEITKKIPILCIEVLPIHPGPERLVGLILRNTFWGRRRWCLVGGGAQHGEPLPNAV